MPIFIIVKKSSLVVRKRAKLKDLGLGKHDINRAIEQIIANREFPIK